MVALRLSRLQLGLVVAATALLLAAIVALVLPSPALPEPATPLPRNADPVPFDPPLLVVANQPEPPLVERNPFDPSRRPPARRRTTAAAEEEEAAALLQSQTPPPNFRLIGTVVTGSGRNIAVIQGNPDLPAGANYHVGDEVLPGFRVTRITRDSATVTGRGQQFDLVIQKGPAGAIF